LKICNWELKQTTTTTATRTPPKKSLMSKVMAVQGVVNLCAFLPSSAKQELKMTYFYAL